MWVRLPSGALSPSSLLMDKILLAICLAIFGSFLIAACIKIEPMPVPDLNDEEFGGSDVIDADAKEYVPA
jgi:hypothetical protein